MIGQAAQAEDGQERLTAGALAQVAARFAGSGLHQEAIAAWDQLNQQCPGDPAAAAGLGLALMAAERHAEAVVWLCAACTAHPTNTDLLRLQAQALLAGGLRGPAIGALYTALDLDPGAASTHAGLGIALFQEGLADAALPHCQEAFRLVPDPANAATLSCILIDLGRFGDARAITEATPPSAEASFKVFLNRSIALQGLGREQESVEAAREAVAAAPDNAIAKHHLAATLLGAGQLTAEAWRLYEARSGLPGAPRWPDPAQRWTGGDITGKTVLLHAEQGLGDTLQFVRYAPLVAARGARVLLAVQPALVRLLSGTPGVETVVAAGPNLPPFDFYCPLLSLPGLFETSLETIPLALPYAVDLPTSPTGTLRVGLVWAGSSTFADDRKRSVPPALLCQLASVPGVRFYNLQFGADTLPVPGMVDLMAGVGDFADTAAAIAGLDLVVTVDTAVAHLAATMGKPVWLLSRFQGCWRWLRDRTDSPWYPTLRIYRQETANDWEDVIGRLKDDLCALQQLRGGGGSSTGNLMRAAA